MNKKHDTDDKRHFSRILFDARCTLHQGDSEWRVELLDVSLRGILINCTDLSNADLEKPFESIISLSDAGESIIMSLQLVHQESTHLGFECQYIDLDSITHLKRLVELNLGDPNLLHRELGALSLYHPSPRNK